MLSNTREAMNALEKAGRLDYYARARGTDLNTFRDTVYYDFGFEPNGKKEYDLGNFKVSVSIGEDLKLLIFNENTGKTVKSIPKKDANPEFYEAAKKDFADLKKNINKVVKNREKLLFKEFLTGTKNYLPHNWKKSYLDNPVLNSLASLLVWQQKDVFFKPQRDGKLILNNGEEYLLNPNSTIAIAHPKNMTSEEVEKWQNYFVNNGLKQPFEQIWEPAYNTRNIKKTRYEGCYISVYRFTGKEEHGISTWGLYDYSEDFGFKLKDCKLEFERVKNYYETFRHDQNEYYKLGKFTVLTPTRYANHIIYLLDKWTIEERIAHDESDLNDILVSFNVSQILDLISLAKEKNSINSLAVLLEYKNSHFKDYDPMLELTF